MNISPTPNRLSPPQSSPRPVRKWKWRGLSAGQLVVVLVASVFPITIVVMVMGYPLGVFTSQQMHDVSLGAGEDPGMLVFGAMFLCSPVQWWTGRSQVQGRKILGIIFFVLALSNGAMFVFDSGWGIFDEPLLAAGSIAVLLALPLFLTSNRRSQRGLGMRRWRSLHKLTYVVAVALVAHAVLIEEVVIGLLPILVGFVARVPQVRRWLLRDYPSPSPLPSGP